MRSIRNVPTLVLHDCSQAAVIGVSIGAGAQQGWLALTRVMPEVDTLKISNDDAAFILGKNGKTSMLHPAPG